MSDEQTERREHTLLLKLTDRPGAMELIAATFAHRGLSLTWTLGSNGAASLDGHATVLVHFAATSARKEAVKRALSRLSRMVSVSEPGENGRPIQKTVLVRLAPGTRPNPPADDAPYTLLLVADNPEESVWSLVGRPASVEEVLKELQTAGVLREAMQALLAF